MKVFSSKGLKISFGGLAILGLLITGACAGNEVASDASLEDRGYASTARLVSTDWVNENLDNENVVIIDIRKGEDYAAGHLPGAINYDKSELQVERDGVKGVIPSEGDIAAKLSALGVSSTDTIIIYDHIKNLWSTRFLWTLDVYGHEAARRMDGAIALWESEGKEITTDVPNISASSYEFTGEPKPGLVASLDDTLATIGDPTKLVVDTRSADEYAGRDVRAERGGHIPESVHVEWTQNHAEDGTFLSASELREIYTAAAVGTDQEIYTLCQTAVRATDSWFVLSDLLGYDNVVVYDGSWTEWGNREDTPIDS